MAKDAEKTQSKKNLKEEVKRNKKIVIEEVKETEQETTVTKKEKTKSDRKGAKVFSSAAKALDDNRKAILFGVVGFLIATLLFRCILWPDRIATLKDGTQPVATLSEQIITADDLYADMKKQYSVNVLLNKIDDIILKKKYPNSDEMTKEITSTAEYYYSIYNQSYGYSKEEFLSNYGFATEADFLENLKLDYRRNKYFESYAEGLVTDSEIEKYYKNDVFGDVDSKHILVKIDKDNSKGLSDADAKKLAKEIISKLNSGKTWDEVVTEYKDKIVSEELGYQAFNASLEKTYLQECKNLEVGKYSKNPVLTSYGYHIVFKIAQKDKPKLNDVKDDIIDVLATEKKNKDTNLYYKALIAMREEAKLEFVDTKLGDEYKKHLNSYK